MMLNDDAIEKKYGIVFVKSKRYYYEDLSEKHYNLECTTPFSLEFDGRYFVTSSWKQLLVEVMSHLLEKDPNKKDLLLEYKYEWNGKQPFWSTEEKHREKVGDGIYLLCNLSALHSCWLLREMLAEFGIDLKKCKFIIYRPPFSEPAECRQFYELKTKNAFKYYYVKLLKHSEERTEQVLRNIEKLNKIMPMFTEAYDNLFLITDNNIYATYKSKLLDYIRYNMHSNDKNIEIANKYLTILGDFYKTVY